MTAQTAEIHAKQYRTWCRQGIWVQVMTLQCFIHMAEGDITLHHLGIRRHDQSRGSSTLSTLTSSYRHTAPQLCLNKSEWLAAPVNVITYQNEIMAHPLTPWAAVSLEQKCGSAGERHFQNWKGREGSLHASQVMSHCRFCHSANQRKRWRWCKTKRGSMFTCSLHHHGSWEHELKTAHQRMENL